LCFRPYWLRRLHAGTSTLGSKVPAGKWLACQWPQESPI